MTITLPIQGRRVSSVAISFVSPYVVLQLPAWTIEGASDAPDYVLQVDGPVTLGHLFIDTQVGPHDPFIGLLGKTVTAAEATENGSLRIEFADGDPLAVGTEGFEPYEPWQLYGSDGSEVISTAGGGIDRIEAKPTK